MPRKHFHLPLILLLTANLPAQTVFAPTFDARLDLDRPVFQRPLPQNLRLAFFPASQAPQQQPVANPAPNVPAQKPGWPRRHLLMFTGLALTGGGAALVAGGGPGQVSGCVPTGPTGQLQCTTATTWGASGRHIGGLLLLSVGVPLTIIGIFKHP